MDNQGTVPAGAATTAAAAKRRTTSVYFEVELLDELDAVAVELERPRTWIIEKAVEEWLERHRQQRQQQ